MKIKSAAAVEYFQGQYFRLCCFFGLLGLFGAASAGAQQLPGFDLKPELTGQAVFSCQTLTISGNSEVDSRGVSTGAAHGTEGHVRSNAGLTLSGNVRIFGNAISGPGLQVVKSGNVTISGTSGPAASPLNCTPIPLAPLESQLLAANNNAQIPRSDKNKVVLSGGSGRVFTLSGNDGVTIPAGNYYFDSLTMSGNSTIRVEGRVNILVKGAISISGGGIVRQLGNHFQLRLWTRGSVAISSNAKFQGFFYAPENAIALSGGADIEGTLFAKNFAISGTVKIRRSVDDTAPSLTVDSPLEGQSVTGCSVEVAGRASDTEENGLVVKVNGQPVVLTEGQFATSLALGGADPSLVVVVATDATGATSQVSRRVELVPPAIGLASPAPGSLVGQRIVALSGAAGHATALSVDGVAATLSGGNWQIPSFDLGADGAKNLSLLATYCGGTVSQSFQLELDSTPPVVAIEGPHSGDLFGSSPIVVTGTVEEAHLTSLTVAGIAATVDGGRFTVAVPLAEGLNTLQATALDSLGRTAVSNSVTVELDSIAPAVTIDSPATGSIVGQGQVVVAGHSEDPNLDSVTVNGVAVTRSGANFSATLTLAEGDNSLVAVARDRAGNSTSSPAVVVVLDTAAPEVEIAAGELPGLTKEATVTVIGSARDPHLDAVVVNGVAAVLAGESFTALVPLEEGANSLVATASDVLAASLPGHSASSAPFALVRDSTPPALTVSEPAEGALLGSGSLIVRGSAADAHLSLVTVGGAPATLSGAAFEAAATLGEGPQTLDVRAVDQLGQATELTVAVIVDTQAPVLEVERPLEGELVAGEDVTVSGKALDPQLDVLTVNGQLATVGENGEFSITFALDGDTITVVATDLLGHATEKIVRVNRQSQPPTLVLDPLPGADCSAGGVLATIGGSYEDDQAAAPSIVLEVRPPAGSAVTYPATTVPGAAGAGRFSAADVDFGAIDGLVTLVAIATDASGEVGRAIATVRVDAMAPTLQLTEGGAPFAGAAPGETPPAGAQPLLLGRRVAFGAIVADGAAGAPPAAILTLDGHAYPAGAPIEAAGNHLLVARATDCAGRTASAHAYFRLDRDAPRLLSTSPADGEHLTAGPATFSGSSDADLAAATIADRPATVANGSFSLSPFPWQEGENRVEIGLVDAAGNRSTFERAFTVTAAPLTVAIRESGLPIASGQLFNRPIFPRAVASTSEATVALSLNGAPFAAGGSIGSSGDYTLTAIATLGNRSATASVTFRLDLAPPPTIRITAPEEATEIASPTVAVRGSFTGEGVTVEVGGLPATVGGGSFEVLAYPLTEQDLVTITATATDRLGRKASAQVMVLHRSAGPWVLILDPADGATTSRDRIDVAGAVADRLGDLASPQVLLRGGAGGDISVPLEADGSFRARDLPLAAGANVLTAEAIDRLGRAGSATVTVFRDSQPPSITFSANGQPLGEGAIFSSDVALAVGLADDSGALGERSVRLNGQLQSLGTGSGFATTLVEEGGYLLSVLARDAAGNESRAERSFLIDRGGCGLADIFPAAGATVETAAVTLTGRAGAAAARLKVRLAGGAGQEYDGQLADGTFLVAGLALSQLGDNQLELVCTDAAGRIQVTQHLLRRVAAGEGPSIEILSPADGALLGSERVAVSGTLSGGEASVNGVAATVAGVSPKTFVLTSLTLAEGPNVIAARAVDSGRIAGDRIVVWRDTQTPKIVITSPDSGARLGVAGEGPATVDVTGRVELQDEPRLPTVQVSSSAGTVTATLDPVTGKFTALAVPLSASLPASQAQLLTATATDGVGLSGKATAEVYLDSSGPAILLSQPADLGRYHENSPAQIAVAGEVWAAPGATVSVNGATLAEAAISWGEPDPLGRRHGQFTAQMALPTRDGAFGIIARVVGADQRYAETRRLLHKDSAAPSVVEILPQGGSTGVDSNALVLVLFSEPVDPSSLAAAGGLELIRQSGGQSQAVSYTFAGNAVAVVPSASLAEGEIYQLRAGTAIRDLSGHGLAAARSATFTIANSPLAAAPLLDPLPAVLCAGELLVKGQATAGADVKVKDGNLLFSGNADAAGRFSVRLPLAASGWHYLSVYTFDPATGIAGPAASHAVRVDCNAPTVKDARLDRATGVLSLLFSESMSAASLEVGETAAIKLRDAEDPDSAYHSATLLVSDGNRYDFQLDSSPEAWWRDRPLRVAVGPPAADERGNPMAAVFEQVFFPGGGGLSGGFLYGEAWDDSQGRPLAGATASLFYGAPGASAPLHSVQADGRGRYTFAGQVAAGRYAVLVEKAGYTPVVRWLPLEPSLGAVAFDARLSPRGAARGTLDPVAGGRTPESDGLALVASPAALPGSAPLEVSLTALSGQGLPDFLPLGYTPAAAAELRLAAGGVALPENTGFVLGEVAVELPLPPWVAAGDRLVAAQYQLTTGRWLALQDPELLTGGRVRTEPLGPGALAILVADTAAAFSPPPVAAFTALEGAPAPEEIPAFAASLELDPPIVAPTGRSLARVVARSQDGVAAWPSGLAVQAFLEEKLILAAGQGQLLEAPFVADLLLYHPRLSEADRQGAAESAAGSLTFVVSPSPRAAQVLLDVGYEKIRLYPFPEETERGQVVGPTGGTVGDPAEAELTVPEGALSGSTVAEVEVLSAEELEDLPAVAGFRLLAAVRLDFSGKELARPATLRLPRPAATADEVAGDPRLILSELVEYPEDQRGAFARLVARVGRQGSGPGQRLVAGPEAADSLLALDGIVREGLYLLLEAQHPLGFATGLVRGQGSTLLQYARVQAAPLGTADLSRLTGRYAVPVPAGADRPLEGLHPITDEVAAATVSVAAGQVVLADLEVQAVAPAILALQPPDGAQNQPTGTTLAITFSEAIDPASVGSGSLRLELAGPDGSGSGVYASGRVTVSGSQLRFESERPLPPGRAWIARFDGGVRDLQGTFYAGAAPLEWRFTTSTVVVPGGQIDPAKFHVRLPENGVVRIWADPGALPLAQSGQPAWTVSPYLVGPFAGRDPVRDSFPARTDGSFEGTVGRAGAYAATIASRIWAVVLDPTGQVAAEFEVGPLTSADGKAFVAQPGEATSFTSAEGLVVDVPAAAFDEPTLVKIRLLPASVLNVATPRGLAVGAVVDLDFAGEARETLRLHVPAPAGAAAGVQVFIGESRPMPWGQALQFLSYGGVLERGGERFLSNDPELQAEPDPAALAGGSQIVLRSGEPGGGDGEGPPQTCAEVKRRGLPQCFVQNMLTEFTHRRQAAFYYESGAQWALLAGGHHFPSALGTMMEAITNWIADAWTYIPKPTDSVGNVWILPVIAGEPLNIEVRDLATGWVLQQKPYEPVPPGGGELIVYPPSGPREPRPPRLVAAEPFDILRFDAPMEGKSLRLRLDLEAATLNGRVDVKPVAGMPLAKHSTVSLFGLPKPKEPVAPPSGQTPGVPPPAEPWPDPIAGPSRYVCDDLDGWQLESFSAADELLLMVAPGDLDAATLRSFLFDFEDAIDPVDPAATEEVAILRDLGPTTGCSAAAGAGYPQVLPIELSLERNGQRLRIDAAGPLAGGHRFELELQPGGISAEGANGDGRFAYPASAPRRFTFATRELRGSALSDADDAQFPFGGIDTARDMLRFGNLLLVGSDAGKIVAFDTSEPVEANRLKLHSVLNGWPAGVRTFATDGHNRLYFSEMIGSRWVVRALRVEDARAATATCLDQPDWAAGVPCFDGVSGSIRVANLPGGGPLAAAQYTAAGALPSGMPSDLEILSQDETGKTLDFKAFIETYLGPSVFAAETPDAEGIYTFDLPLESTWRRSKDGRPEPSKPGQAVPNPATRVKTCTSEEAYDRFQRVTVDNLTTGQTWSLDIENAWPNDPQASGDGRAVLSGLTARRGDQLRVRYNLRALGYVSINGSGISVVDLSRTYRLPQVGASAGNTQCGRRLGRYEGADITFPACAMVGEGPQGLRYTPALDVHSETGCAEGEAGAAGSTCRGTGRIDVYTPLLRVGGIHSKAPLDDPGFLGLGEMVACINEVGGEFAQPVGVALANDVTWVDYGIRGGPGGVFSDPPARFKAKEKTGDLLFLALGRGGVFAFDVSDRKLDWSRLIGHFRVKDRTALRLQFDEAGGLLLVGGNDLSAAGRARPVIDVLQVRFVNTAPNTRYRPAPIASLFAPWGTRHLAIDPAGTGLLYTWDPERGPIAVPISRPKFVFSGLYLGENEEEDLSPGAERPVPIEKITAAFLPLGAPMEAQVAAENAKRFENDKKSTAAFKLRVALPGVFGDTLTAKVESLRILPEESLLTLPNLGAAVSPQGGPGWAGNEVVVKLRRIGVGEDENNAAPGVVEGEGGRLGIAYNLYESVEKVLLIADPRAGREYRRQKAGGPDQLADEESQCRRCQWPSYLPDPENTPTGDPELLGIKELLAGGPYLRAILYADPAGDAAVRQKTEEAIAYFAAHQADYPAPAGTARVLAPATPVASPFQASLAEPAQHAAMWSAGEAGVGVSLTGGDLLVGGADHVADGRAMPFSFSRSYRSQSLGYGPLGSAGWHGNLFARLYENQVTGEVEYHDGGGNVWRFFPPGAEPGSDYELDPAGSYLVAKGVYLRLQKLPDGGWRLLGRHHDSAEFDAAGRLLRMSDRHRRGKDPDTQGSTIELGYDAFGQLSMVTDDLGRHYRFEYFEDPRPVSQGGDGPRFGLLKRLEDFAGRQVEYEFDEERRLTKVKMPEVKNPIDVYQAEYSFEGIKRPTLEYRYGKQPLVDDAMSERRAVLHGDFAKLRLSEIVLPSFTGDATPAPRAIFGYAKQTGRLEKVSFPKPDGSNSAAGGVVWQIESTGFELPAGPAEQVKVVTPWGHEVGYKLEKGRIEEVEQTLAVVQPTSGDLQDEPVKTSFEYAEDGRLEVVDSPDGGKLINCYADAKNEAGQVCPVATGPAPQIGDELPSEPPGPPPVDRLALANVVKVIQKATTEAGKGAADYDSLDAAASYEGDNLVSSITDGLARGIQMPVPQANAESRSAFQAEGIGGKFEHDAFGRVKKGQGGTTNPYEVSVQFKADAKGKKDAGLPERVAKGNGQIWSSFDFDPQNNLKRLKTSQGAEALADYDLWDRLVRSKEGLADGRLAPVGNGRCGIAAEGSITERAFDAAGHLARERRLQDFMDAEGNLQCRWVESSYTYNLREQLVEVAQTHLADPNEPGRAEPAARTLMRLEYDAHGRLLRHLSLNSANPNVETVFDYDSAGRVRSVKLGDAGAQTRAYDRKSRVVKTTDGDEAIWRGRYDVWDRLFLSQSPTGAFTKNVFDKAGHLTETVTTDRDPFGEESGQAQLLAKTKSHFTSFSEPDKVVEILVDEQTGQRQILVTSREFDDAGRTKAVWSGPAQAETEEIDPEQKRRESETVYEAGTGRVLEQWRGGYAGQAPLVKQKFGYLTDNKSPWPDRMAFYEAVPGESELVETASASYRRDAMGRVIEEKRNDGSLVSTTYDRSSNLVLQVRTGADSLTRAAYDGAGRQIRVIRPNDRGETLYARDLDGRLLEQVVKRSGEDWVTKYEYDRTGRPTKTSYHDGSFAETTYNADSTVATQRSREGVLVTFGYDAANRPLSQVPSLAAGADISLLVALDAGNFAGYDKLSRPTSMSRGSAGGSAADAGLSVIYPNYDLGSRPGSEVVGARGPMSWRYDVYSRREKTFLPAGPGRDPHGPFQGWSRQFDTLDRVTDVAGVGALSIGTPGATWTWGGGRLYAMNTKGSLGTSLRLGYLGGEGPQLPSGAVSSDSKWKLGTLTWGAGGNSATGLPATTWGQFGFGYRGTEGDPRDGAKIGREAMAGEGLDLFAGQGWSWDYDAGVRLSAAWPGRGDLQGGKPEGQDGFLYEYGKGDELERVIDESAGTVANTETGAYGRITSRGRVPFSYDQSGRRSEDDRFVYLWNWRSELMQVTVKETWPNGEATPFAGHQVRYAYDAMGRLHSRSHHGLLSGGVTDENQRPLIEKRVFVWEGQSLLAEAGYGDQAETQLRWRKTYVPGAGGLDDAVQVVVENVAFPAQGKKLYTYLRDELGTVLGVVAEEESQDPANPTIPARYHYTPYGEAHAEIGPELRRVRFDAGVLNVAGAQQAPTTPQTANGALRLTFSIPVDPATIAAGLVFEEQTQSGWQPVSGAEMVTGFEGEEGLDLLVSLRSAWKRNTSYRIRAGAAFKDEIGRALAIDRQVEFTIPASAEFSAAPVDHRFPIDYESWRTAGDTLGGRLPGGQTSLFQGHWTDPVTGINFARARWYDSRNATWLSEDPLLDVDSPNLYTFVSWSPAMGTDPMGTCWGSFSRIGGLTCVDWTGVRLEALGETGKDLAVVGFQMAKGLANIASEGRIEGLERGVKSFVETEGSLKDKARATKQSYDEGRLDTMTFGFYSAKDKGQQAKQLVKDALGADNQAEGVQLAVEGATEGDWDKAARGGAQWLGGASQTILTVATLGEGASTLKAKFQAKGRGGPDPEAGGGGGPSVNNPHEHGHGFSARNVNPEGGDLNCAACSVAMDSTLKGQPTVAPNSGVTLTTTLEAQYGQRFTQGLQSADIIKIMEARGPGSQGIVFGYRPGQQGHFFNVVNQKGTVRFIDAQKGIGAKLTGEGYKQLWLLPTN